MTISQLVSRINNMRRAPHTDGHGMVAHACWGRCIYNLCSLLAHNLFLFRSRKMSSKVFLFQLREFHRAEYIYIAVYLLEIYWPTHSRILSIKKGPYKPTHGEATAIHTHTWVLVYIDMQRYYISIQKLTIKGADRWLRVCVCVYKEIILFIDSIFLCVFYKIAKENI